MLLPIENVLTAEELTHIQNVLVNAEFVDGRVTAGYQSALVKNNLQLAEQSPEAQELGALVLSALARSLPFSSAALPHRIYPPLFSRTTTGMSFGNHVDNAIRGSINPIRTDLSVTIFLSEPSEYDGGELVINDTYGTHNIKLPAGNMVLYPATSLHQVTPVTRGVRNACFFWIQSMVRDDAQRSLLFDLDRSIISLHQSLPNGQNNAELLTLAGCYHNLLRQWAEL
jgi:PKHD-type hydroxylase